MSIIPSSAPDTYQSLKDIFLHCLKDIFIHFSGVEKGKETWTICLLQDEVKFSIVVLLVFDLLLPMCLICCCLRVWYCCVLLLSACVHMNHMILPLVQGRIFGTHTAACVFIWLFLLYSCTVWKNEGIHPVKLLVMVLS